MRYLPHIPDAFFEDLRHREFARLDEQNQTYLDYTGAALFPESLVAGHLRHLTSTVLGNPHSDNPTAQASASLIEEARCRVLDFFGTESSQYEVVFTANATAAIKLVAEGFAFGANSSLLLTKDNHNSVNGVREFARRAGAGVSYCRLASSLQLDDATTQLKRLGRNPGPNLFAFPAQSNFSGIQHDLSLVQQAQDAGFEVLLDAAAFVPTNPLDLRQFRPEYVCISFYKMFGYPTGIGALLIRRDALGRLRRPWFAGGTVDFVSTQSNLYQLAGEAAGFEDGTANFGSVSAVTQGLNFLQQLGYEKLTPRLAQLMRDLVEKMTGLRHRNNVPLVRWYGANEARYGNTRAFNLQQPDGRVIDYEQVEQDARRAQISIRGGCFCNPGCAEAALQIPEAAAQDCLASLAGRPFKPALLRTCLDGLAVGALRISVGIPTTQTDIDRWLQFLTRYLESDLQESELQRENRCDNIDSRGAVSRSSAG